MTFNWTTIKVADLEKSLHFYHDLLGLPVADRFGPPGHEIAMLGEETAAKVELLCAGEVIPAPVGAGVSMGFTPDNMADLLDKLSAAGVTIPEPMSPNPALRFYFIQDPDGYTIQLVEHLA